MDGYIYGLMGMEISVTSSKICGAKHACQNIKQFLKYSYIYDITLSQISFPRLRVAIFGRQCTMRTISGIAAELFLASCSPVSL